MVGIPEIALLLLSSSWSTAPPSVSVSSARAKGEKREKMVVDPVVQWYFLSRSFHLKLGEKQREREREKE